VSVQKRSNLRGFSWLLRASEHNSVRQVPAFPVRGVARAADDLVAGLDDLRQLDPVAGSLDSAGGAER